MILQTAQSAVINASTAYLVTDSLSCAAAAGLSALKKSSSVDLKVAAAAMGYLLTDSLIGASITSLSAYTIEYLNPGSLHRGATAKIYCQLGAVGTVVGLASKAGLFPRTYIASVSGSLIFPFLVNKLSKVGFTPQTEALSLVNFSTLGMEIIQSNTNLLSLADRVLTQLNISPQSTWTTLSIITQTIALLVILDVSRKGIAPRGLPPMQPPPIYHEEPSEEVPSTDLPKEIDEVEPPIPFSELKGSPLRRLSNSIPILAKILDFAEWAFNKGFRFVNWITKPVQMIALAVYRQVANRIEQTALARITSSFSNATSKVRGLFTQKTGPTNLVLSEVEKALETTEFIEDHPCGISFEVPEIPLLDPTNRTTIYNKEDIEKWLRNKSSSPITREYLTLNRLIPMPAYQAFIADRKTSLSKDPEAPINQALLLAAKNELVKLSSFSLTDRVQRLLF